jgi:hypothetical protein
MAKRQSKLRPGKGSTKKLIRQRGVHKSGTRSVDVVDTTGHGKHSALPPHGKVIKSTNPLQESYSAVIRKDDAHFKAAHKKATPK